MDITKNIKTVELFQVTASSGKVIQATTQKKLKELYSKEEKAWEKSRTQREDKQLHAAIKNAATSILKEKYPIVFFRADDFEDSDDTELFEEKRFSYSGNVVVCDQDESGTTVDSKWFSGIISKDFNINLEAEFASSKRYASSLCFGFNFFDLIDELGKDFNKLESRIFSSLKSEEVLKTKRSMKTFLYDEGLDEKTTYITKIHVESILTEDSSLEKKFMSIYTKWANKFFTSENFKAAFAEFLEVGTNGESEEEE